MGPQVGGLIAIVDRDSIGSERAFVERLRRLCARMDDEPRLWVRARSGDERPPPGLVPHPRLIVPATWAGSLDGPVAVHRRSTELGTDGSGRSGARGPSRPGAAVRLGERGPASSSGAGEGEGRGGGKAFPPLPATLRFASVHDRAEVALALAAGADALLLAPVFAPRSKPGTGRGLALIEDVVGAARAPVFALGGVTPERVAACLAAGAVGVAVLSPVSRPDRDPDRAIDALLAALSA